MRTTFMGFQSVGEILRTMKNELGACPLPELSELLEEGSALRRQADAEKPPKSNTGAQIGKFSFGEVSE